MIKKIPIAILAFVLLSFSFASATPKDASKEITFEQTTGLSQAHIRDLANQTMAMIYDAIRSKMSQYDGLMAFDQSVMRVNPQGVSEIKYYHEFTEGVRAGEFLDFGITIVDSKTAYYPGVRADSFYLDFPLLGIKFAGYQRSNRHSNQFQLQEIVKNNGNLLLEEQNRKLPLKLLLEPAKDFFSVGEKIEFIVELKNVSSKILRVRDLGKETLYFLYAGNPWGAVEKNAKTTSQMKEILLKPGESIRKRFIGSGSTVPEEFELYASYALTVKGVNPICIIKIRVY